MRLKSRSRKGLNKTLKCCQKGIEIIESFKSPSRVHPTFTTLPFSLGSTHKHYR